MPTRIMHVAAIRVPFTNCYTMRLRSILREHVERVMQPTVITSPFYPLTRPGGSMCTSTCWAWLARTAGCRGGGS